MTSGSNILYAPTNACTYTSSGFWYDRDLSRTVNEVPADIQVFGSESNYLYGKGSSATITDAIIGRGAVFPSF